MATRKTTAESVSAARRLDHLMMLMTVQITKSGTKPTKSMIKRAISDRDKIYELMDEVNETPDLKFDL